MIDNAPSLTLPSAPVTVALSVKLPTAGAGGSRTVKIALRSSSSRLKLRDSGRTGAQVAGTESRTTPVAAPRVRFVTITVTVRVPPVDPSIGQTIIAGDTATSNGWVTRIGRRISPMAWSRKR